MKKPYEVLGVDCNADEAAINAAFRRAAKECHPDLNKGDRDGERRLRRLIAARAALARSRRRDGTKSKRGGLAVWAAQRRRSVLFTITLAVAVPPAAATGLLLLYFMSQSRVSTQAASPFQTATVSQENPLTSSPNPVWKVSLRQRKEVVRSRSVEAGNVASRNRRRLVVSAKCMGIGRCYWFWP
ncbi:MAG: DnaJ domain-containing protein [Rhodomicrobium sp.]